MVLLTLVSIKKWSSHSFHSYFDIISLRPDQFFNSLFFDSLNYHITGNFAVCIFRGRVIFADKISRMSYNEASFQLKMMLSSEFPRTMSGEDNAPNCKR